MRRGTLEILIKINDVLEASTSPYSINEVSLIAGSTWRTAKKCLDTLCQLGIACRRTHEDKTRIYYGSKRITNEESGRSYIVREAIHLKENKEDAED